MKLLRDKIDGHLRFVDDHAIDCNKSWISKLRVGNECQNVGSMGSCYLTKALPTPRTPTERPNKDSQPY
jgi:hypothetical protein